MVIILVRRVCYNKLQQEMEMRDAWDLGTMSTDVQNIRSLCTPSHNSCQAYSMEVVCVS